MQWVVTTGRTIEEAKEAALDQLGVDESEADFEILEEPRRGIFGIGGTEARVRARVRPKIPRPKDDGRRRRRRERPADIQVGEAKVADVVAQGDRARAAETARDFVAGLVRAFGLSAEVRVSVGDEGAIEVTVEGDDLGVLIGPKGQTLVAVTELVRTVVQRRFAGQGPRVSVDVAGYRQKRRAALERFARRVAEEVRTSGVPRALEPMSPADRKVVHDAVNPIPGVTTTSVGDEPRRRVVIVPEGD